MGGRKRKSFNRRPDASKKPRTREFESVKITSNMKGFLITYNCKFTFCVNEAKKIIQQFSTKNPNLLELEKDLETPKEESPDLEKQLKQELDDLNQLDKDLSVYETGAKYTIFIATPSSDPNEIAAAIYGHIERTRKPLGRYTQRFLPIMRTCKASLYEIEKSIKLILDHNDVIKNSQTELGENAKKFTYSCVFKTSNNGSLSREDVFKIVATYLASKNKGIRVNLEEPDYVILFHIICNLCYISFVNNFYEYRKYNLVEQSNKFNEIQNRPQSKLVKSNEIKNEDNDEKKIIVDSSSNTKENEPTASSNLVASVDNQEQQNVNSETKAETSNQVETPINKIENDVEAKPNDANRSDTDNHNANLNINNENNKNETLSEISPTANSNVNEKTNVNSNKDADVNNANENHVSNGHIDESIKN